MIPAVFQVTFAAIITGAIAIAFEQPWTATPDAEAVFAILWLGILGSGLAYLAVFRLFAHWGATRTTTVAYVIPVVGIVLGYLVLAEPIDARIILGTVLVVAGIGLVNSRFGRRRIWGRTPALAARSLGRAERGDVRGGAGEGRAARGEGGRSDVWRPLWRRATWLPNVRPSLEVTRKSALTALERAASSVLTAG